MDIGALIESAGWWAYAVVFAMSVGETSAFIGVLVPGETTILFAAAMAGSGHLDPVVLAVLVVVGGVVGDSLGYALGHRHERRKGGRRSEDRGTPDSRVARARSFLLRHGGAAVFIGRFIGVVRTFLPFAAGSAGLPYPRFLFYSAAASLVWGVGNVLLGYYAGAAAVDLLHSAGLPGALTLVLLAVVVTVAVHLVRRIRKRGRPEPIEAVEQARNTSPPSRRRDTPWALH